MHCMLTLDNETFCQTETIARLTLTVEWTECIKVNVDSKKIK